MGISGARQRMYMQAWKTQEQGVIADSRADDDCDLFTSCMLGPLRTTCYFSSSQSAYPSRKMVNESRSGGTPTPIFEKIPPCPLQHICAMDTIALAGTDFRVSLG